MYESLKNIADNKYKNKYPSEILTTIMQWFVPEDLMWVGKNLDAGASDRTRERTANERRKKQCGTPTL